MNKLVLWQKLDCGLMEWLKSHSSIFPPSQQRSCPPDFSLTTSASLALLVKPECSSEQRNSRMAQVPELPIPISFISGRYLLFSADAASYLRREHRICGVLTGTLPQVPQQNVFLGLPLELMPEEARLLAEKGVAVIVDEYKAHEYGIKYLKDEDKRRYIQSLENEGLRATKIQMEKKELQREEALKKIAQKDPNNPAVAALNNDEHEKPAEETDSTLFEESRPSRASSKTPPAISAMGITPPTSFPLLPYRAPSQFLMPLPEVPPSYPLFAHLHSKGYYISPGLRFGCQYMAYPGDPLRFHSHFLATWAGWDEELDLMEIVSGGRLGTGVKKSFLLGGVEQEGSENAEPAKVRTFSIEWAGM